MYTITCFKKLLTSPAFLASVIGTSVICMFSTLYYDPQTNSPKTVIEMYLQYSRSALLSDTRFCSYSVFTLGFGNWIAMFVPVIVTLSSISIYIDERKSGVWRFALHRTGRVRYAIGGCLFILLSGGFTLTLGYGLYGVLAAIMFPPISAFPAESTELFIEMSFRQGSPMSEIYQLGGLPICIAAQLAETFFYGALCSAAAMLLSAVCENKYVIICTPFFLKYALSQFSLMIGYKAIEDPENFNEKLLEFANIIHPDAANSFLNYSENLLGTVILNTSFLIILSVLFCVIRIRRLKNEV